jgi:hypothetical protein
MRVTTESKRFKKEMDNIMSYSFGFLDGVQKGKTQLFNDLAPQIVELASQYIDSNARVTPELLHHVYEWTLTIQLVLLEFLLNQIYANQHL